MVIGLGLYLYLEKNPPKLEWVSYRDAVQVSRTVRDVMKLRRVKKDVKTYRSEQQTNKRIDNHVYLDLIIISH